MRTLVSGTKKLGLELTPRQAGQFELYYRELIKWNQRVNLTAITGYEDVQLKHFLDALTVVLAWSGDIKYPFRVIDVGTGAGIPGLPLRIALPAIRLVLLDSIHKKAAFLTYLRERLGLDDIEVVTGRAEDIARQAEHRERYDVVLSRAVAALPTLVELTLPFGKVGGRVVLHKKGDFASELEEARKAIEVLGGKLSEVKDIRLEELPDSRYLIVIDKVKATPKQYPRRAGIPGKRPLG